MDRIDNGVGSFVMGTFRYSSFVGTANQTAKPARTNATPLGKPCSSMLRPENFLSDSCIEATITYQTNGNPWQFQTRIHQRPNCPIDLTKDNSSFTGAALRGSGVLFAMWRDPQGDGRMRPGDWLVLLIGSALIIVSALVFL